MIIYLCKPTWYIKLTHIGSSTSFPLDSPTIIVHFPKHPNGIANVGILSVAECTSQWLVLPWQPQVHSGSSVRQTWHNISWVAYSWWVPFAFDQSRKSFMTLGICVSIIPILHCSPNNAIMYTFADISAPNLWSEIHSGRLAWRFKCRNVSWNKLVIC